MNWVTEVNNLMQRKLACIRPFIIWPHPVLIVLCETIKMHYDCLTQQNKRKITNNGKEKQKVNVPRSIVWQKQLLLLKFLTRLTFNFKSKSIYIKDLIAHREIFVRIIIIMLLFLKVKMLTKIVLRGIFLLFFILFITFI